MKRRTTVMYLLVAVIMVTTMALSLLTCITNINRISEQNSEKDSRMIAYLVSNAVENRFLKPITVSETMARDYALQEYMKKSGEVSPEFVEEEMAKYLSGIRDGFGYQMVFAVCDNSKAYYTYNGISKYVDVENDEHDIWYKLFVDSGKHYDLDVDTDEVNAGKLSVFVNTEVSDEHGNFLGICGVGVEMNELQDLFREYENEYNVKINLIDETGFVQVDTETTRIENAYLESDYLAEVRSGNYLYDRLSDYSRVTTYMDEFGWYLVITDYHPVKIDAQQIVEPSVIIFAVGIIILLSVLFYSVRRERKMRKELKKTNRIAMVDELTGIYNRRAYEKMCAEIENRTAGIAFVAVDVNGLKTANDTKGHQAGDELITATAQCMRDTLGKMGKVFRTGGDEFMAIVSVDSEEEMKKVMDAFDTAVKEWRGQFVYELTVSKGYMLASEMEKPTVEDLEAAADKRMYEDKRAFYERSGRDRRGSGDRRR